MKYRTGILALAAMALMSLPVSAATPRSSPPDYGASPRTAMHPQLLHLTPAFEGPTMADDTTSTKSSSSSPTPGSTAVDKSNTEGPNAKGSGNPTASNLGENPTGSTGPSPAASSNAPVGGAAPAVGAADAAARGATSSPSAQAQALAAAISTALTDPKGLAPEAPSVAEQAKAGSLPDPTELALKARGITGSGRRLDETIAGGLTVHPDGYWQNSEGVEVDTSGKVVEGGNKPRIDLSGARVQQM